MDTSSNLCTSSFGSKIILLQKYTNIVIHVQCTEESTSLLGGQKLVIKKNTIIIFIIILLHNNVIASLK